MGKRRAKRLPTADRRLVLAGPIAIKEGHSTPFRNQMQIAYDLGASGEPMPAWIAASTVCRTVHCYGKPFINSASGRTTYPHWTEFEDYPHPLQRAFNAGAKAKAAAETAMVAKGQMETLVKVLADMGMPATDANIQWARNLSKQAGGMH